MTITVSMRRRMMLNWIHTKTADIEVHPLRETVRRFKDVSRAGLSRDLDFMSLRGGDIVAANRYTIASFACRAA
jgi:hypothetical protein